jgi:hypothetical protein
VRARQACEPCGPLQRPVITRAGRQAVTDMAVQLWAANRFFVRPEVQAMADVALPPLWPDDPGWAQGMVLEEL